MSTGATLESENAEIATSSAQMTTPPPVSSEVTPPELTPEIIAQGREAERDHYESLVIEHLKDLGNTPPPITPSVIEQGQQAEEDWKRRNTPPELPTTPPPIPPISTPPPLPQEYKINQVTNRYKESLDDIKQTEPALNSAKEKEARALKKATRAQLEANEGQYNKPENGVENEISYIGLQLKKDNWGRARESLKKIVKEQSRPLGGEVLANSSLETMQHATNPARLETLIDANQQDPIEKASPEMQSALEKQDELAKQLKP